ncbi:MAG: hypothetical protein WBM07_08415, partial [Chitinivibrionales bacterium]
MKLKLLLVAAASIVLFVSASSSQAQCGGTYYTMNVTQVFSGPYPEGDAIVFWGTGASGANAGFYYFNLTGTEASREMASLVML